jgi:hypothetical protein
MESERICGRPLRDASVRKKALPIPGLTAVTLPKQ